jgi:hypothetical protein
VAQPARHQAGVPLVQCLRRRLEPHAIVDATDTPHVVAAQTGYEVQPLSTYLKLTMAEDRRWFPAGSAKADVSRSIDIYPLSRRSRTASPT